MVIFLRLRTLVIAYFTVSDYDDINISFCPIIIARYTYMHTDNRAFDNSLELP